MKRTTHANRRVFVFCIVTMMSVVLSSATAKGIQSAFASNSAVVARQVRLHKNGMNANRALDATGGVDGTQEEEEEEEFEPLRQEKHLVLVGGGHAHVQVIKALNVEARPKHLKVTLIDAHSSVSYSGMVPGSIANLYQPEETRIPLKPLAEWSGVRFVNDCVVDIDLERKQVYLRKNGEPISFDAISLDIGSTSRGLDETPGARTFAIPTRPIDRLVQRLEDARQEELLKIENNNHQNGSNDPNQQQHPQNPKVVVIGAGAAGIELAMAISSRWNSDGLHPETTILDAGHVLVPQESDAARSKLVDILKSKQITVLHGCTVQEIESDRIVIRQLQQDIPNDGSGSSSHDNIIDTTRFLPYTHCVWATGAGAHPLAHHLNTCRGLATTTTTTTHDWIQVGPTLQSTSHPFVFAAGDCASIQGLPNNAPPPPKAGVYAVRSGPILIENLTRFLESNSTSSDGGDDNRDASSSSLVRYEPQKDFLKLLVCGEGKALGFRFGLPFYGKWVFDMKDEIDRNFMNLFRVDNNNNNNNNNNNKQQRPDSQYNTKQYDEEFKKYIVPIKDPHEAALLIQREDDQVDYRQAWGVLRAMAENEEFRDLVLNHVSSSSSILSAATVTSLEAFPKLAQKETGRAIR